MYISGTYENDFIEVLVHHDKTLNVLTSDCYNESSCNIFINKEDAIKLADYIYKEYGLNKKINK